MTGIAWLYLYNNSLTGSIPTELGDMTSMVHLILAANQLSGEIPSSLGNPPNLRTLYLSYNTGLTGELPLSLMNRPITALDIRCTGITVPDNADFRRWLAGIDTFLHGCGTSTGGGESGTNDPGGPTSDFLTYNYPN
ncbi:MAG: hypothetical protein F4Y00_09790, partial [Bacteroidetes bacterium SB0662_bin_6]|nr:hypothetical protein [Bacteroidetes bacterium SB0662_bin_6]